MPIFHTSDLIHFPFWNDTGKKGGGGGGMYTSEDLIRNSAKGKQKRL